MARSRGFEPLTAWFVARYSIQLSYERAIFDTKQGCSGSGHYPYSLYSFKKKEWRVREDSNL